jgi:hypothetical protein
MPAIPPKGTMTDEEAAELAGGMYENCDIQMAIESGQFESLDDVLTAVKARSSSIERHLKAAGRLTARHISREAFAIEWSLPITHKTGDN